MFKVKVLAVALGLSLLAACGQAEASRAQTLQPGQTIRGEITSASPLNYSDGSRSQLYQLQLDAGQVVRFVAGGALDASLALYRDGELVGRSRSQGAEVSLAARAPVAGRYQLAVSGSSDRAYGPFTVSSTLLAAYDGGDVTPGQDISGYLDDVRELPLVISEETVYDIDFGSDDFDTVLALSGNGLDLRNDDSQGTDSRITTLLKPGRYSLLLSSFDERPSGLYTLRVKPRQLPAGVMLAVPGPLALEQAVSALLVGQPVEYQLEVPRAGLLQVDMQSEQLDSALQLRGATTEAADDDGGEGLNARLRAVVQPGTYTVTASSAMGGEATGSFTLRAQLSDVPANAGGGSLAVGRPREAVLYGSADNYELAIGRAAEYTIEMRSGDMDSMLRLYRDGQEVASDDDSAGGLDARIRTRLQPGRYTVQASSLGMGGSSGGNYRISVSAD